MDDSQIPPDARDAQTLRQVIDDFEEQGYGAQFATRDGGAVECLSCRERADGRDLRFYALHRLEGVSDPADMIAVAAVCCPRCDAHGTLVLNYGPEATAEDAEVLRDMEDLRAGSGTTPSN